MSVRGTTLSANVQGLVADCHRVYNVSVTPHYGSTTGPPADGGAIRPSGIIAQGTTNPPYVVILVDGVGSHQPGFTDDPYKPSYDQRYCPESVYPGYGITEGEANFYKAPNGPRSFFHKRNYGEINTSGNATGSDPNGRKPNNESEPRALPNPKNPKSKISTQGYKAGTPTHSFMLDALAAQGSIFLPYEGLAKGLAKRAGGRERWRVNSAHPNP